MDLIDGIDPMDWLEETATPLTEDTTERDCAQALLNHIASLTRRVEELEAERKRPMCDAGNLRNFSRCVLLAHDGYVSHVGGNPCPERKAANEARDRIAELEREGAGLLEDAERLDWLWSHTHGSSKEGEDWIASWVFPDVEGYEDIEGWPDDIRKAIDAARALGDGEGGEVPND